MITSMTTGASSAGFVSGSSGILLLCIAVVAVLSIGPAREAIWEYVKAFVGLDEVERQRAAASTSQTPQEEEADSPTSAGLASSRDSYDFDLELLAYGNPNSTPDEG